MQSFAFVNVSLDKKTHAVRSRKRAISEKDLLLIRTLAASKPRKRNPFQLRDTAVLIKKQPRLGAKDTKRVMQTSPTKIGHSREAPHSASYAIEERSNVLPLYYPNGNSISSFSYLLNQLESGEYEQSTETCWTTNALAQIVPDDTSDEYEELVRHAQEVVDVFCSRLVGYVRSGRIDPFWAFSIPFKPSLSAAINHRFTYLSPPKPDFDKYFGERASRKYAILTMHDPVFMFSDALFSATDLYMLGQDPSTEHPITEADLTWLKGCTYSSLYRALQKKKKTNEELDVCGAALMALACYEVCFGNDMALLHMHVTALLEVIKERGGLNNLLECHRRLIEFMEIQHLAVDDEKYPPQLEAGTAWSDVTPGWVDGKKEKANDPDLAVQPYTNEWIVTKVSGVGSAVYRASMGRF